LKRGIQRRLRALHVRYSSKDLPQKLGIYFHAVEGHDLAKFGRALTAIEDCGYEFVSDPGAFLGRPGKVAWLSFDDNYATWLSILPVLGSRHISATFYVNTLPLRDVADPETIRLYFERIAYRGPGRPLSSEELIAIASAGHTIGAHTHSHRNLASLDDGQALDEVTTNIGILEGLLSRRVEHFAFPFGLPRFFPRKLEARVLRVGLRSIAYATPGMQHALQKSEALQRTPWRFDRSLQENLEDLAVDGRLFVRISGRSPVG
jgi:peptidoglycan/xylan/chitin deacetylase (PgdA/CDA1 family)